MTSKLLRICGKAFINTKGLKFDNRVVDLVGCGDIHPFRQPGPIFEQADTLFIRDCNKNFVYYWLKPSIFPNVKNIYLASHPCEPMIFNQWEANTTIYLSEFYSGYKLRWAKNNLNVKVISKSEIEDTLKEFEDTLKKFEDTLKEFEDTLKEFEDT